MYICMYVCTYVYVCIYASIYICVNVCLCVPMYMHVCIHVDVWMGMGMIVYICMSLYVHMSTLIKLMDVIIIYLISTLVHGFVYTTYTPLSTVWIFITLPFTIWSYIIPTSIVAIQLKSNNKHKNHFTWCILFDFVFQERRPVNTLHHPPPSFKELWVVPKSESFNYYFLMYRTNMVLGV